MKGDLFYKAIGKIAATDTTWQDKTTQLYALFQTIMEDLSAQEQLYFNSLFTRIAYVGHRYQLPAQLIFFAHRFRTQYKELYVAAPAPQPTEWEAVFGMGIWTLTQLILNAYQEEIPDRLRPYLQTPAQPAPIPVKIQRYRSSLRVTILDEDKAAQQLLATLDEMPSTTIRIAYNVIGYNELFNATVQLLRTYFRLPVPMQLLDCEVDSEGVYRPKAMVIEPDYLVDVTAVAENFEYAAKGHFSLPLVRKLLPSDSSLKLIIGNIANYFLDTLLANPDADFATLRSKIFTTNPLAVAGLDNAAVKDLLDACKAHFSILKNVLYEEFPKQRIYPADCYIEPSFYSPQYGLQGRLDVLHLPTRPEGIPAIVELKSGKPFNANAYRIGMAHYIQTLLYDLLITGAFDKKIDPANYILYSGIPEHPLRFAPATKVQQYEALQVRNQLVALERVLATWQPTGNESDVLENLKIDNFTTISGYIVKDIAKFDKIYAAANALEKAYYQAFVGFVAREHLLAKVGSDEEEQHYGNAALWHCSVAEKEAQYRIFAYLTILDNQSHAREPIIKLQRTERTNPLANFRKGDIAVFYPFPEADKSPVNNQLFKCTIIDITPTTVTVRLRSAQSNQHIFATHLYWNIEGDLLDNNFGELYRYLTTFLMATSYKKELLLGLIPPRDPKPHVPIPAQAAMTAEQYRVFSQILHSQDYFLLWGPPGTGKTSVMLRYLVQHWLTHTEEQLLILAFTNRAVDEICAALHSIGGDIEGQYLRIGSRYATDERYTAQLFDQKIAHCTTRKALLDVIAQHRIVVATVASMQTKKELFSFKKFNRVIIDEASQLLEPALVGLLPHFDHFLLIGDHKQLPAVVTQPPTLSAVKHPDLHAIGLTDLRNSLFERLYRRAQAKGWHWAYAQLSHQGRMHQDLMRFPNEQFYESTLQLLPPHFPYLQHQQAPLPQGLPAWLTGRLVFIPTTADVTSATGKTNRHEAQAVAKVIEDFLHYYMTCGITLQRQHIGVITPYRAQIAQINQTLADKGLPMEHISVDTVERYQGGAREVIILSLCTNFVTQLKTLVTTSTDNVDRKLNVALTRAKQYIIIVGNPAILNEDPCYRLLLSQCEAVVNESLS